MTEYDLEAWATLQGSAEPGQIMGRLQGQLGLGSSPATTGYTTWGQAWQVSATAPDGAVVQLVIQNDDRQPALHRSYSMIRCKLAAAGQSDQACRAWEQRLWGAMEAVGIEHHLYLTVRGAIPRRLSLQAEQALGKSLCQELGGHVTGNHLTEQYLSLTGYSPLLPEAATTGSSRVNINIALVGRSEANETQVYLGTPVITTEY